MDQNWIFEPYLTHDIALVQTLFWTKILIPSVFTSLLANNMFIYVISSDYFRNAIIFFRSIKSGISHFPLFLTWFKFNGLPIMHEQLICAESQSESSSWCLWMMMDNEWAGILRVVKLWKITKDYWRWYDVIKISLTVTPWYYRILHFGTNMGFQNGVQTCF